MRFLHERRRNPLVILLARMVLWPIKVVVGTFTSAFRAGQMAGGLSVRAGRRTSHLLGIRGTAALVIGVVVGLALAPMRGREFRGRVRAMVQRRTVMNDVDIADRVTFELEHAPRTWHLPQPGVSVNQARVTLSGEAPQETSRDELARVAAAVPGVVAVDNLMTVTDETANAVVDAD